MARSNRLLSVLIRKLDTVGNEGGPMGTQRLFRGYTINVNNDKIFEHVQHTTMQTYQYCVDTSTVRLY